ncbi:nSTAND1 domain-containing NTPase [Herbidospora sp. RD11066]
MTGRDPSLEPYVGLRSFRRQDSGRFFGRQREAHEVCDLWRSNQVTVLYGPSGAGKTSLIYAGVLPLLDPSQNDILPVGRVSARSGYPSAALPEHNPHVYALLSSWSPGESPARLADLSLQRFFSRRGPRQDPYGDPVLRLAAIDQAEDLFLGNDRRTPYQEWFIDQLIDVLKEDLDLRVLISIRDDQVSAILRDERLDDKLTKGRFALRALGRPAATKAVVGPLTGTGCSYDDDAAQQLIADLSGPESKVIEPVQLQIVCTVLWNSLPPDVTRVTREHVLRYARVQSSLETFIDQNIAEIAGDHLNGDTARLRTWLRANFVIGTTRAPVFRGETLTAGMPNAVLTALVDRHIVAPLVDVVEETPQWYELSHENLVRLIRVGDGETPVSRRTPQEHLHAAQHALRGGDFARASREGRTALAMTDSLRLRAEIESFLGDVAFAGARYAAAIDHYREAALVFEVNGQTEAVGRLMAAIGRSRRARSEHQLAIRELVSAIARVPDDMGIRTELARAYWYAGHPVAALEVLDRVLDEDAGSAPALRTRGEVLLDLGRPEEALLDFSRIRPMREPWVRAAYAYTLAKVGQLDKAQIEITAVRSMTAEHGPALLYAALVEEEAGNAAAAAELARDAKAAEAPPLPAHLRHTADRLVTADPPA